MKCCCSCKAESWVRVVHFTLTFIVFYVLLTKSNSDLHEAWNYRGPYLYLLCGLLLATSLLYLAASLANPGYLAKNLDTNDQTQQYVEEGNATSPGAGEVAKEDAPQVRRFCHVCCAVQPMRTKHCYVCGRCVRKFDHHCPWLGNCVGEKNHKLFWLFLLTETVLLIWGNKIAWSSLEWHSQLGEWMTANILSLLCFFIIEPSTIAVAMLLVYHTYLMLTGQTTWEQAARQRILYLKDLDSFLNPFDEGCCRNIGVFLCRVSRNWDTIYSKTVYR